MTNNINKTNNQKSDKHLLLTLLSHHQKKMIPKQAVLLHCYVDGEYAIANMAKSQSLLHETCKEYKITVMRSLYHAAYNIEHLDEIIEILENHARKQKISVITNDYKLASYPNSTGITLNSLITSNLIDLYQAERKVILTKIKSLS